MFKYREIDMASYNRKQHFDYFNSMANPYMGVTVNVEITDWITTIKAKGYPFFLSFLYAVVRAANQVPEFRRRILDGNIIEFESCPASFTLALEDETYCYCTVEVNRSLEAFLAYGKKKQEEAKANPRVEDGDDALAMFFVTSLPWLTYQSIVQPVPDPADSNPRITWGKYQQQGEQIFIPVSVLCHHGLVDGIHLGHFYQALEEELRKVYK